MSQSEGAPYASTEYQRPVAELDIPEWLRPRRAEFRRTLNYASQIADSQPAGPFAPQLIVEHHLANPDVENDRDYYIVGLRKRQPNSSIVDYYDMAHDQARRMAQSIPPTIEIHTHPLEISYIEAGVVFHEDGFELKGADEAIDSIAEDQKNGELTEELLYEVFNNPRIYTTRTVPGKEDIQWPDGTKAHIVAIATKSNVASPVDVTRKPKVSIDNGHRSEEIMISQRLDAGRKAHPQIVRQNPAEIS